MTHFLFYMHLEKSSSLLEGRLLLVEGNNVEETCIATSGCIGHQFKAAQSEKGKGPIPSCLTVGIKSYRVSTHPIDLSGNKGVRGDFFHITPDPVTVDGVKRGEFGIHFDANVPGSAGCIVLRTEKGWAFLKKVMQQLRQQGFNEVNLIVSYS